MGKGFLASEEIYLNWILNLDKITIAYTCGKILCEIHMLLK